MISDSIPNQAPQPEAAGGPPITTGTPRPRWLIPVVGLVVLLAIVIGIVAAMTLTGTRQAGGAPGSAGYAPANTTMYYEVRLDLPGDQRANLRAFLGHFPQVNADKYLTDELDGQLDALTASESPAFAYSKDVKPWFNGTIAVALVGAPDFAAATQPKVPDMLIVAGVRDQQAATAVSDRLRAEASRDGTSVTSTSHAGQTIWTATPPAGTASGSGITTAAWTITTDAVVFGTSADLVGKALDAHSGSSLAGRQDFRDAVNRLPADRVGTAVIDTKALLTAMRQQVEQAQPSAGSLFDGLVDEQRLGMVAAGSRFESNRFVTDTSMQSTASLPANKDRGLAAAAPGDAFFFADGGDVGTGLTKFVNGLKAGIGAAGSDSQQLGQVEALLGGKMEDFVSWIGDAALVAGSSGGQPYVGVIATPTDAAAARTKLGQLRGLIQLMGQGNGGQVTITDADHNGTTITTVRLPASNDVPAWLSSIQWAATDQRVVIGTGESFVSRVLDMQQGDSLAAQARYQQAMGLVGGASNVGGGWLDLAGIRAAVEPMLPQDVAPMYESVVKSWLAPFDYVAWSTRTDGSFTEGHAAIVVK